MVIFLFIFLLWIHIYVFIFCSEVNKSCATKQFKKFFLKFKKFLDIKIPLNFYKKVFNILSEIIFLLNKFL